MTNQSKAYLYAGSAVLMWSTVGSAFKLTLRYVDPVQMLWFASFTSILVMGVILVVQGKARLAMRSSRQEWFRSAANGFINPFAFYIVLFYAYDLLLTQEAMVINFSWPITLTIFSILLLRQKITYKSIIAILVSFAGIIIIALQGDFQSFSPESPGGVALALLSTVLWSLFWISNMKDKRDETLKLFLNFIFGFFYITLLVIFTGRLTFPSWEAAAGSLYIGIFEMGIAYVLWLKALQLSTTTARVSILIFFAPFLSLVIINLTVGEAIHANTLWGLMLIVGGIVMQRVWR